MANLRRYRNAAVAGQCGKDDDTISSFVRPLFVALVDRRKSFPPSSQHFHALNHRHFRLIPLIAAMWVFGFAT